MPKLNVQQNNQNVIQAFKNALAIGNLKGIIASDGSHNFSTAGSNRNLLDNPWFTVNQRSATTVTLNGTEAYITDRWIAGSFGTYTHNSDNTITITCPNSTAFAGLTQRIDPIYMGGTYTYSVRLSDDTVISLQGTMPSGSGLNVYNITINGVSWQALFRSDGSAYWITLRCNVANATLTVKAAKLELGSVSTLANDAPPELSIARIPCYENHLRLKGQYAPVGYAIALSTTLALLAIPTPVPMRIAPTPSLSGTLYFNAGTPFAITSVQNPTLGVNQVMIQVVGTFDTGKVYLAQFRDANSYLDLSADL